ncbi:uncharacterized protein [Periplaneta americana]|uniref:uncharacterized protein n=1 Tax=Periplaneta americana TaxID=6978 RepID=UPI0037E82E0C
MFVFAVCILLVAEVYCNGKQDGQLILHLDPPGQTLTVPASVINNRLVKDNEHQFLEAVKDFEYSIADIIDTALKIDAEYDYVHHQDETGYHGEVGVDYNRRRVSDVLNAAAEAIHELTRAPTKHAGLLIGPAATSSKKIQELEKKYDVDLKDVVQRAKHAYRHYNLYVDSLDYTAKEKTSRIVAAEKFYSSLCHALQSGRILEGEQPIVSIKPSVIPNPQIGLQHRRGLYRFG